MVFIGIQWYCMVYDGIAGYYMVLHPSKMAFLKKNCEKAVRLTAWVDPPPPLPRSGQVNVKISRQVAIFGVILSFYKGQKWVKIFTNSFGTPSPQVFLTLPLPICSLLFF